jgi:hypothetical protein
MAAKKWTYKDVVAGKVSRQEYEKILLKAVWAYLNQPQVKREVKLAKSRVVDKALEAGNFERLEIIEDTVEKVQPWIKKGLKETVHDVQLVADEVDEIIWMLVSKTLITVKF